MTTATITYFEYPGYAWSAHCDVIPGFNAGGDPLDQAREMAIGLARFAGWDGVIIERLEDGTVLDPDDAAVRRGEEMPIYRGPDAINVASLQKTTAA